jgi:Beta-lactamase
VRPGFLTRASYDLLYTRPKTEKAESPMSFGWFVRETSAGPRRIHITGSNPGVQAALYVYPDSDLVLVVLSNSWGVGSGSGELVGGQPGDLPERIAAICGQNPQRR